MSKLSMWAAKKYVQFKHREEEAQGLAEYGLILALIAVVAIAALTLLGENIATLLTALAGSIVP